MDAYSVLGASRIHRVPDLVFDLKKSDGSFVRCALEIEKTVKSQARYAKLALAYLDYSKVDVVLFGCSGLAGEIAVRRAFSGPVFAQRKRIPGTFHFAEFDPHSLQTTIRFQDREFRIQDFLEIVTKSRVGKMDLTRERNENPFAPRNPIRSEVA